MGAKKYFSKKFVQNKYPANVISTEGSLVLVGKLPEGKNQPDDINITVTTAASTNDTSVEVKADKDIRLQQGKILYFFADVPVTIAETVFLEKNTPKTISVESLESNLVVDEFATTWEVFRVLSPQSIPVQSESSAVNRKDYTHGLQGQEVKTRINLSSSIEIINRYDDEAYWLFIQPASRKSERIFGAIVTGSEVVWGPVNVSDLEDSNELEDISRITTTFDFQFPFARAGLCEHLNNNEKITKTSVVRRLGVVGICNIFDFIATENSYVFLYVDSSGSMGGYTSDISNALDKVTFTLNRYLYKNNPSKVQGPIRDGSERWLDWAYQSLKNSIDTEECFYFGFINESEGVNGNNNNVLYYDNGSNYKIDYDKFTVFKQYSQGIQINDSSITSGDTTLDVYSINENVTLNSGDTLTFTRSGVSITVSSNVTVTDTTTTIDIDPLPDPPPNNNEVAPVGSNAFGLFRGQIVAPKDSSYKVDDFILETTNAIEGNAPYDTNGPGLKNYNFMSLLTPSDAELANLKQYMAIIISLLTNNPTKEIERYFEVYRN